MPKVSVEVMSVGHAFAGTCGLISPPGPGSNQARLGIISNGCSNEVVLMLAAFSQRIVVVPISSKLNTITDKYIIEHAELSVVACSREKLPVILERKASSLSTVILLEKPLSDDAELARHAGVELLTVDDLIRSGEHTPRESATMALASCSCSAPTPADWACFLYKETSADFPKSVILSHNNVLASVAGLRACLDRSHAISEEDVYLPFLTLAYSLELTMEVLMMASGASIGFSDSVDASAIIDSDVPALRPTVTMAVPDVLRLMHRKVLADVKSKGAVSKFVFNRALGSQSNLKGTSASKMPGSTRVLEKLHQRLFGGRIRLIFSSGNPLAPPLQSSLSSICGCPILQIYSLAESAGAAMVTPVCLRGAAGNVGAPLPSVEVKLVDTTHLKARDKYPSTLGEFAKQSTFRGKFDRQQAGANLPRGQICVRGPSVSPGYFKDRVDTEKAWDEMGWLHTGDAGMWNSDGSMSFLNQFENNFRMAHEDDGAFSIISIQEIEEVLAGAKRVRQIFVHGDESHSSLVAVIVPDVEALSAWYETHSSKSASPSSSSTTPTVAEMCGDPRVYAMFEKAVRRCAKEGGLRPWEVPKILSFETEIDDNGLGFTVENGGMTTWSKLRHPHLSSKYSATIKSLYAQCPPQSRARTSVKTHEANLAAAAPGAKAA